MKFLICILAFLLFPVSALSISGKYSKYAANGVLFQINPSQLNKMRLRPQIINEHAESSRSIIATVTSSVIAGQAFRASHDNINGIDLMLESAAGVSIDDFESYANDAALQTVWVETDAVDKALLETTIVNGGTQAMELPGDATILDIWTKTITSTDYTDYTFTLYINSTNAYSQAKLEFYIGDGANTKSLPLITSSIDLWTKFDLDENAFAEDAGTTDIAAITKIGIRLVDTHPSSLFFIDDITAVAPPGSVDLKLWNMGTSLPIVSSNSIDDGTQYVKLGDAGISGLQTPSLNLPLIGGRRLYHINGFVAGVALEIPTNELLDVDNYYAITINYVDTDVSVYGPNVSLGHQYNSGFSFTAPDEATAVTATGAGEDLMFAIYSTQDVYVSDYLQFFDATPGPNSQTSVLIENKFMKITDIIVSGTRAQNPITLIAKKLYFMGKGSKFEQYYNPDFTDSVTSVSINIQYFYIPNGEHG